jgi:tetratricopeptide (TPR) repeat protein
MPFIPVIVVAVIIIAVVFFVTISLLNSKKSKIDKRKKNQDEKSVLQAAEKRLESDPANIEALLIVGDNRYKKGNWSEAFKIYETLSTIQMLPAEVDVGEINLRAAVSALNLDMTDVAFKCIMVAYALNPSSFEICYQLGNIEFQRNNYEKAAMHLKQAYVINPEFAPASRLLGHAYFRLKQNKEALFYIRKAIELDPNDKESLFTLAECYIESEQKEQAERIYGHLRPDPVWGAEACLRSGMIKIDYHNDDEAISDFQIGLKHSNIRPDILIELHYQIGTTYLRLKKISEALSYLQNVQASTRGYKDTDKLIEEYREFNVNRNLQIFVMASPPEFLGLCRKIAMAYYAKANIKITKAQLTSNEWADVVAEIDTPKWSDIVIFRFIRTQGTVGELVLRDFQASIKDIRAGKGICFGAGTFSEEAKRFTEARLIDLIEKDRLMAILKSIDAAG